jgi:hypothetical protein
MADQRGAGVSRSRGAWFAMKYRLGSSFLALFFLSSIFGGMVH